MIPYVLEIPGADVSIEMVPVPGGSIILASPAPVIMDGDSSAPDRAATPSTRRLPLSDGLITTASRFDVLPFWIGKTEITMRQYMPYRQLYFSHKERTASEILEHPKFDDVDGVSSPTDVYDPKYNFEYASAEDSPVPTASQFAARQYTKWLSLLTEVDYRLPLRSEWKHACQARVREQVSDRVEEGDETLDRVGVYFDNAPVPLVIRTKTRNPNSLDIYDMRGNLSEWVVEDTAMRGLFRGHVAMGGNFDLDADDCQCDSMIRSTDDWWDEDPDFPNSPWWATSEDARATGFRIVSPLAPLSAEQKRTHWAPDSEMLRNDVRVSIQNGRATEGLPH